MIVKSTALQTPSSGNSNVVGLGDSLIINMLIKHYQIVFILREV
jgi:hypothetical protein